MKCTDRTGLPGPDKWSNSTRPVPARPSFTVRQGKNHARRRLPSGPDRAVSAPLYSSSLRTAIHQQPPHRYTAAASAPLFAPRKQRRQPRQRLPSPRVSVDGADSDSARPPADAGSDCIQPPPRRPSPRPARPASSSAVHSPHSLRAGSGSGKSVVPPVPRAGDRLLHARRASVRRLVSFHMLPQTPSQTFAAVDGAPGQRSWITTRGSRIQLPGSSSRIFLPDHPLSDRARDVSDHAVPVGLQALLERLQLLGELPQRRPHQRHLPPPPPSVPPHWGRDADAPRASVTCRRPHRYLLARARTSVTYTSAHRATLHWGTYRHPGPGPDLHGGRRRCHGRRGIVA